MYLVVVIAIGLVFLLAAMAGAWLVIRKTDNGGLADIVWTFALGIAALFYCFLPPEQIHARTFLVGALTLLWTFRLGLPLWRRNVGGAEDARYTALRTQYQEKFWSRLFWLLMVQAVMAFVLALTIMVAAHNPSPLGALDAAGLFVMAIALWGGHLADNQLARFKKDETRHGTICDIGLWGRSRHPNYFFEVMFWAGWPLLALSGGWWMGVLAFAAPALMYWLLRYVSGEPLVEQHMARRYGDMFQEYSRRVPPFFPRLFKK